MKNLHIIQFLLIWFSDVFATSELLSVVQIFRHGERTPLVFYPNDPYQDPKYWNGLGPGTLTENGILQLNNLGKYFRKRYNTFIGQKYNGKELSIKSSNSNRNIQSAKHFLNGLFPNSDFNIPIEKTEWPILSILVNCLKFNIEYLKLEGTNEQFIEVNQKNRKLYNYIREHSEFPIFGLFSALLVWDTLKIEHSFNLSLPEWTKDIYPFQLNEVSFNFSKFSCLIDEQQRLGVGPFLNELIEHFERIMEGVETPKIILYSGHDLNLSCFLNAFGYFKELDNYHLPPFASSLTFELKKDESKKYFVSVYYKPEDKPIPVSIRNCKFECEWEEFKNVLEDLRITKEEWYKKCYYL